LKIYKNFFIKQDLSSIKFLQVCGKKKGFGAEAGAAIRPGGNLALGSGSTNLQWYPLNSVKRTYLGVNSEIRFSFF
jgi:hypothetical protein